MPIHGKITTKETIATPTRSVPNTGLHHSSIFHQIILSISTTIRMNNILLQLSNKTRQLSKKRYIQVFFQKTLVYISFIVSLFRNNRSYTITLVGSDAGSVVSTLRKSIRCPRFSDMPLHDILSTLLQRILVWQSNTEWHTRGFQMVPPVSPFTNGYIASPRQERVVVKTLCRLMIFQWDIFRTFIDKKFRTVNKQKPQHDVHIAVTTFFLKRVRPCFHTAVFAHELYVSSRLFTSDIITRYSNCVKQVTVYNLKTL